MRWKNAISLFFKTNLFNRKDARLSQSSQIFFLADLGDSQILFYQLDLLNLRETFFYYKVRKVFWPTDYTDETGFRRVT
ncbi:hypothetical protein DBB36_14270 [Flavobacterium sp. WLB]|nr:hypothetical protein AKO67_01180 [Flavobacterium sp. VMW]OWU91335.1 hypothetical protein APR43_07700 [Flavobacterium sp. NLM]PUU69327.1 hypothetical protein DBB36_14270 [Flavobacterium sp. WLB]